MNKPHVPLPIEVDCQFVKQSLDAGEPMLLVDCREADEYEIVSISQAVLIPMSEIQNRLSELEPQRNQRVVIHCHHGGRSLRVAHWLRQQGFASAQSMAGGIDAWAETVDPSLPRY